MFAIIRGLVFYASIVFGLVFIIPPWLVFCALFNKKNKFTAIARPFFRVLFAPLGIKVKIEGEKPKQLSNCFILSNHQSFLDVPVILYGIAPTAFLAKKSLFNIFYFGSLLKYAACIPVQRGNAQANANLHIAIKENLSNGYPVGAFPEGTRSATGEILPFKNGIFKILKEAEVPILPITIIDAWRVFPKNGISIYPGTVSIILHKLILEKEIKALSFEEIKNRVREEIAQV